MLLKMKKKTYFGCHLNDRLNRSKLIKCQKCGIFRGRFTLKSVINIEEKKDRKKGVRYLLELVRIIYEITTGCLK